MNNDTLQKILDELTEQHRILRQGNTIFRTRAGGIYEAIMVILNNIPEDECNEYFKRYSIIHHGGYIEPVIIKIEGISNDI